MTNGHGWGIGTALGLLALAVAGCGSSSSSSSGPSRSTSTQTLNQLEVQIVRTAAQAPSLLARFGDLLGWPRVAEASHCTVSSGGVSAQTGPDEKARLTNVPVTAGGTVPISIDCGAVHSELTLTGAVPGSRVSVTVEVEPGRLEAKIRDEHVSPPSQPSPPSKPSQPSKPSGSAGSRRS